VLETNDTARKKGKVVERSLAGEGEQLRMWDETKKPRPRKLPGYTYSISTPVGKAFVTINENGGNQPFEVFVSTAKAGSEIAAVSEAIGRLISYVLRLASPIMPRERLREIIRQLSGIGGGRSLGFGPNRVRSLPDGVAQTLAAYLVDTSIEKNTPGEDESGDNGYFLAQEAMATQGEETRSTQSTFRIGDLCPECGQAAVVYEEGCRKCYACAYSEC